MDEATVWQYLEDGADVVPRWTYAMIDLDAFASNVHTFQYMLPDDVDVLAVVKANAYGHGAVRIAAEATRLGVRMLGVAFLAEALALRAQGIKTPILVMGHTPLDQFHIARDAGIAVTVYDLETAFALPMIATDAVPPLVVHIKIDTGMGRIGFITAERALEAITHIKQRSDIVLEGLYTHYACADEEDGESYTQLQYERLQYVLDAITQRGMTIPLIHAGNSAIALRMPFFARKMVRLGLGLYGISPLPQVEGRTIPALRPVLSWHTRVVMVKRVPPQTSISYGRRYTTCEEETIVTLPIGYADGLSRRLSGKSRVLLHGRLVPIVGTICMDQCMVSVPHDMDVAIGDPVVVIGVSGDLSISIDDMARQRETIAYEVLCGITERVPRHFFRSSSFFISDRPAP